MNSATRSSRVVSENHKKTKNKTHTNTYVRIIESCSGAAYPFSKQNLGQSLADSIAVVEGRGNIRSI